MTRRINYAKAAPGAMHAMLELQRYTQQSGLDHTLLHLVKLRASQINGCGYCLDMHSKDARAAGETEQRIYVLNAWREAPFYSERERAALAWTEEITMISEGVSEEVLEATKAQFNEKEIVDMTMGLVTINAWNRLSIGLGAEVGSYQVPAAAKR